MPSMSTRRKHLGCAVYCSMIYAVGGRDDCTELSSAERYNPILNQWSPIVAMTSRRSGVGLAVVNGMLYAVGGFDGTTYLKTIEYYDPDQNQWCLCGSMNYRRLGGGVGVVRLPNIEPHLWWKSYDNDDKQLEFWLHVAFSNESGSAADRWWLGDQGNLCGYGWEKTNA